VHIREACIFSENIATEIRDIGVERDNCTSEISRIIIGLHSCKIILHIEKINQKVVKIEKTILRKYG